MSQTYFSDLERGTQPRIKEEICQKVWEGIVALITTRLSNCSFGFRFPLQCNDGAVVCGCDELSFSRLLQTEVPEITWPPKELKIFLV